MKHHIVQGPEGHMVGFPYAKPLGVIYEKIQAGLTPGQARATMGELERILADEKTHHHDPTTLRHVHFLEAMIPKDLLKEPIPQPAQRLAPLSRPPNDRHVRYQSSDKQDKQY